MDGHFLYLSIDTWKYLSMPVISAIVGYVTNVVAIRMMFHPLHFVGLWKPYLGWQGIVPRKASKMTGIAVDTITESLITEAEIFGRLDPERVAAELERPMIELTDEITDSVMRRHHPGLWEALPQVVRSRIKHRVRAQAPAIIRELMTEVRTNVRYMFDLKGMITRVLVREKHLLNRIFLETGRAEFVFIGRSGAYFGFAFGLVQMLIWMFFQPWWLLPAFGLLVGWATNWLALKMIFNPKNPIRIGPFRIQGLFFKRQGEVAADYGSLVATQILTPANILEEILTGPYAEKLFELVRREVEHAIDDSASVARPFVTWTLGSADYERIKAEAVREVVARMPGTLSHMTGYAENAMAIQDTLVSRLQQLTPRQFEGMLRPAFEEDEWILIAVGAALGLMVGWFQLVVLFSSVFTERFGSLPGFG
ncbi:DUF445 domain-containing protein [Salinisphaera orenii]|uniref:DUF445 domain-containing protein n=1 Tax=Salinisphaera orenii YIM 95161 TaxID=1051139 RepID=A0A423Q0H0_9GAMM|nr:DUF445 family protein [Salinisphaera halophila]ROO31747.1 hypothetical protein SAHL_06395 [Salinisphaera halophila YIM 95161]